MIKKKTKCFFPYKTGQERNDVLHFDTVGEKKHDESESEYDTMLKSLTAA